MYQRALAMPHPWMDDDSGGLVDDGHLLVLVHDLERDFGIGLEGDLLGRRHLPLDAFSGTDSIAGGS